MTYIEVMQAAFQDELEKIAAEHEKASPKKLTTGESIGSVLLGGPQGYFGASKAREHGHSALEGGIRGVAGYGLGSIPGALLGGAAGRALGGEQGGRIGFGLGGIAGGIGGYKALTHPMGVPAE